MKKRILWILTALVMALTLVGCNTNTTVPINTSDSNPPLTAPAKYEKSTYSIKRYKGEKKGGKVVAEGTLTVTVEDAGTMGTSASIPHTKVTQEMSLTYNDDASNGVNAGLTDTVRSVAVFQASSLAPYSSRKVFTIADREGQTNLSYAFECNYTATESGKAEAKYYKGEEFTAYVAGTPTEPTAEKKFSADGEFFDNESIYVALRAFGNVAKGKSQTFKMINLFEVFSTNKVFRYSMKVESASDLSTVTPVWTGGGKFGLEPDEDGIYKLKCIKASLSIDSDLSGPPIVLYYSNVPFKVSDTVSMNKPLVQIETKEYDVGTVKVSNETVYVLSDYSVTK